MEFEREKNAQLETAFDHLREHFDSVLVVVMTHHRDGPDGDGSEYKQISWQGHVAAIGLAEYAKAVLIAGLTTPSID
jgi:hypothetical protein